MSQCMERIVLDLDALYSTKYFSHATYYNNLTDMMFNTRLLSDANVYTMGDKPMEHIDV